jgi:hypothetical protein
LRLVRPLIQSAFFPFRPNAAKAYLQNRYISATEIQLPKHDQVDKSFRTPHALKSQISNLKSPSCSRARDYADGMGHLSYPPNPRSILLVRRQCPFHFIFAFLFNAVYPMFAMGFFDRLFGTGPRDHPTPRPPSPTAQANPSAYPVIDVPGKQAVERWFQLREEGGRVGFHPLIVGDAQDMSRVIGADIEAESPEAVSEILASAAKIEPVKFFEHRQGGGSSETPELGEWPDTLLPEQPITAVTDILSGAFKPKVFIAKIPTLKSYEVPAYLHWGGWNECPMPEEHVTILRHWNELYGAEIISLSGDVLECAVNRPPTDKETAFRLAHEQYLYCADIVDQGVGSLYALAAQLINSRTWSFWWD